MFDLLIRNAQIYDGTGSAPFMGDVAVLDGKIAAVGHDLGSAHKIVDAGDLPYPPALLTAIPMLTERCLPIPSGIMCCAWV